MENKLPNFLLVGTAKAGTTSLYNYLKQHPAIYMSPAKEPHFLISDSLTFPHKGPIAGKCDASIVKDFEEYKRLFSNVKNETSIGEASTVYLYYYKEAIPNIKKLLGRPKIMMILRNPTDRAFSTYMHQVRDGFEPLSFEAVLREENRRIEENWPPLEYYTKLGFYYNQVKAYWENFSDVKIYLFEDLRENALELLRNCYNFLNVDDTFVPNNLTTRYNVTGRARNKLIHSLITKPNPIKLVAKTSLKILIGEEEKVAVGQRIKGFLLKKPTMKQETREYLIEVFREDILALQDLIDRDLSHWLK